MSPNEDLMVGVESQKYKRPFLLTCNVSPIQKGNPNRGREFSPILLPLALLRGALE